MQNILWRRNSTKPYIISRPRVPAHIAPKISPSFFQFSPELHRRRIMSEYSMLYIICIHNELPFRRATHNSRTPYARWDKHHRFN